MSCCNIASQYSGGQLFHISRQFQVRYILEIGGLIADLVGIAQGRCEQALVERLQHHDMLAPRSERHGPEATIAFSRIEITDDGECPPCPTLSVGAM